MGIVLSLVYLVGLSPLASEQHLIAICGSGDTDAHPRLLDQVHHVDRV